MVNNPAASEGVSVAVTSDTSDFSEGIDGAIASLGSLGAKASAVAAGGIAVLAGALGTKSVSAAADFESAMADVAKVTDRATAEALRDNIQQMSEEIPLTTQELATLTAQAGRFGVEGEENIARFTEVAGEMGAATTLSAEEAGRSLAKVSEAIGEPIDDIREVGDAINELSNNMKTNSQEIVDSAQRGGFALQQMGLSSDQILAVSAAMNEVAPTSRRAATMMRQVGQALQDPKQISQFTNLLGVTEEQFRSMREESPETLIRDIAAAMGENEEAAQSLTQSLSTAQARAFRRVAGRSEELGEAMQISNEAMKEGGSLSREVSIETNTLQGQFQLLKSEINNVFIGIGNALLPAVKDLVDGFSEFIDMSERVGGNAAPVLINAAESVTDRFEGLKSIGEDTSDAIEDNGNAFKTAGRAAKAAANGNWSTAFDTLSKASKQSTATVKQVFVGEGGEGGLTASVSAGVSDAQKWMRNKGADMFRDAAFEMSEATVVSMDNLSGILVGPDGESGVLTAAVDAGVNFLTNTAPTLMGDAMQAVGKGIRLALKDMIVKPLKGENSIVWDQFADGATWLINNVPRLFMGLGKGIVDGIIAGFQGLVRGLVGAEEGEIWTAMQEAGDRLADNAGSLIGHAGEALASTFIDPIDGVVDYITSSGPDSMMGDIRSGADAIAGAITDPIEEAWNSTVGGTGISFDGFDISAPDWVPGDASFSWDGFSFEVPKMETGGFIEDVGPALLHPGERVLPETQVTDRGEASFDPTSISEGFDDSTTASQMLQRLRSIENKLSSDRNRVTEREVVRALQRMFDRQQASL